MSTGVGQVPDADVRESLAHKIAPLLDDLARTIASSRRHFSSLSKTDVPETAGLYVIYQEEPFEVFYAGIAKTRKAPSSWGVSDGLRFRIMENHLAYRGDDNFVKYVGQAFGLTSRPDIRAFIQRRCSVQWMEVPDLRKLCLMEHLAIAALDPRFNRG
jgi:hypothetical protein